MTRLQTVRRPATATATAATTRTRTPGKPHDAQLRAAAILGRIIAFFEAVEACSSGALETTRSLLVDELEVGRTDWTRAPHENRRRNAVLTAALGCVHAAAERGDAQQNELTIEGPAWLDASTGVRSCRPMRAGRIMYLLLRILDGVEMLQDSGSADGRPRGVDVLAHMLRGPEPRTWSRDQQDFARCALEWMKGRTDDSQGSTGLRRWSTSARRAGRPRPGNRAPNGKMLSA